MQKKAFDKTQHTFAIKILQNVGIGWTYLNIVKATYDKPTVSIMFNGEKLKTSLWSEEEDKHVHSHQFYSTQLWKS